MERKRRRVDGTAESGRGVKSAGSRKRKKLQVRFFHRDPVRMYKFIPRTFLTESACGFEYIYTYTYNENFSLFQILEKVDSLENRLFRDPSRKETNSRNASIYRRYRRLPFAGELASSFQFCPRYSAKAKFHDFNAMDGTFRESTPRGGEGCNRRFSPEIMDRSPRSIDRFDGKMKERVCIRCRNLNFTSHETGRGCYYISGEG